MRENVFFLIYLVSENINKASKFFQFLQFPHIVIIFLL